MGPSIDTRIKSAQENQSDNVSANGVANTAKQSFDSFQQVAALESALTLLSTRSEVPVSLDRPTGMPLPLFGAIEQLALVVIELGAGMVESNQIARITYRDEVINAVRNAVKSMLEEGSLTLTASLLSSIGEVAAGVVQNKLAQKPNLKTDDKVANLKGKPETDVAAAGGVGDNGASESTLAKRAEAGADQKDAAGQIAADSAVEQEEHVAYRGDADQEAAGNNSERQRPDEVAEAKPDAAAEEAKDVAGEQAEAAEEAKDVAGEQAEAAEEAKDVAAEEDANEARAPQSTQEDLQTEAEIMFRNNLAQAISQIISGLSRTGATIPSYLAKEAAAMVKESEAQRAEADHMVASTDEIIRAVCEGLLQGILNELRTMQSEYHQTNRNAAQALRQS